MTEEKSIEEVESEYKAELQKKVAAMKEADAKQEKADADAKAAVDAKEAKEQRMAEVEEAVAKALGVVKDEKKILDAGEKPIDDKVITNQGADGKGATPYGDPRTAKEVQWMNAFLKVNNYSKVEYGSLAFMHGTDRAAEYAFTDSDDGCADDPAHWRPADVWCNAIWYAAQCGRQLSGVVTYRACDINAGDGLSVQIRTIASNSDLGGPLGSCECAKCVSDSFSTHTLTLQRYDIYKLACNLDLFSIGPILKEGMLQVMADDFIRGIDAQIWTEMLNLTNCGGAPGFTETLLSDALCDPIRVTDEYCCAYAANLYGEIIQLEARMRAAGYGKSGFKLVLSPTVATYLKRKEGISVPYWVNNISMDGNKLAKIGDIDVIEYCGATACTGAANATVAVLLDPTRAIGEAYGKKPFLKVDEDPIECDSWKYVMRCYIAVQCLDLNAIGHVKNPA